MLEWMQKHKKYLVLTVWVSALALIFASMVEWGGGGFSAVSSDSIAKVGDIYISSKEYRQKYNELYDNLAAFMRQAGLPEDGKPIAELEQEAFRILVQEKLLIMLANDIGVSVTPNEILETLLENPDFKDATGNFNAKQYKSLLAQNGWTTQRYESFVADILLQTKMQNFPIATLSTLETNAFMSAAKIKDEVAVQLLRKDSLLQNTALEVTDIEARNFWEKNKNKYMQPPHYKIAYIALDTSSMDMQEDVLERFYKDNEKKYNAHSLRQALDEVKRDYKKGIIALASAYMDSMSKKLITTKDLALQPSNVITTMEANALSLLQKHFDSDRNISDIAPDLIPLYSLELEDNGKGNMPLLLALSSSDSHGLLSPLEYSEEHWIIPYIIEKTEQQPLSFEEAKESVRTQILLEKENEEFKKMAYGKLAHFNTESMPTLPFYLSVWQDKESIAYKQLSALGLSDDSIKKATQEIMMSKKSDGLVFLDTDKALLFRIIKQKLPDYADLVAITNAEDEALKEMKIRDFRNALLDYASKQYKIIDYRRQN